MDMLTVDVTDCDDVEIGTRAILWGHNPGVDEGWQQPVAPLATN